MSVTHVVGIDPGLVHTGVVRLVFNSKTRSVWVQHEAFVGCPAKDIEHWVHAQEDAVNAVIIEGYKTRGNLANDPKMVKLIHDLKHELPGAQVLVNMGVKKVIRRPLMELLGVWSFTTPTHHQDLRSAARIVLFGMAKDDELNNVLADIVLDHLTGDPWKVVHA